MQYHVTRAALIMCQLSLCSPPSSLLCCHTADGQLLHRWEGALSEQFPVSFCTVLYQLKSAAVHGFSDCGLSQPFCSGSLDADVKELCATSVLPALPPPRVVVVVLCHRNHQLRCTKRYAASTETELFPAHLSLQPSSAKCSRGCQSRHSSMLAMGAKRVPRLHVCFDECCASGRRNSSANTCLLSSLPFLPFPPISSHSSHS